MSARTATTTKLSSPVTRVDHTQVIGTCQSCHNGTDCHRQEPDTYHQWRHLRRLSHHQWLDTGNFRSRQTSPATVSAAITAPMLPAKTRRISRPAMSVRTATTALWVPADRVDHTQVIGTCQSCHNGTIATGKNPTHITSGDTCDDCHTTNGWMPANFRSRQYHWQLRQLSQRHRRHRQKPDPYPDQQCLRGLPHRRYLRAGADTVDHTQVIGACQLPRRRYSNRQKSDAYYKRQYLRRLPYDCCLGAG